MCSLGEDVTSCPEDCGLSSECSFGADVNKNNVVDINELLGFVSEWRNNRVSITDLFEIFKEWKNGC